MVAVSCRGPERDEGVDVVSNSQPGRDIDAPGSETLSPELMQRLVRAGIITSKQARQIMKFQGPDSSVPDVGPRPLASTSVLAIILGVAFVLASGALLIQRLSPHWAFAGRLSVTAIVMVLGLVTALRVRRFDGLQAVRLTSALWFIALVALVAMLLQILQRYAPTFRGNAVLVGVVIALAAGSRWRNQDSALLFAATYFGVYVATLGLVFVIDRHAPVDAYGAVILALGAAGFGLGVALIHPESSAMAAGQFGLLVGALLMFHPFVLSLVLGLAAGAVGAAAGVRLNRNGVSVVGVATFFIFVLRLLDHYVTATVVALVAFVGGIALVTYVIRRGRDLAGVDASSHSDPPDV